MKADFKSLALIAEYLASLYEDGISLTVSLDLLQELPLNKEYKKSLIDIKNNIMRGRSLGDSFGENTRLYPKFFSGIVDIGENSGELSETLKSLNTFYFNVDNVRKRLKSALRYPLFILGAVFLLMIVFFMIIIPNIYENFNDLGKSVPFIIKLSYKGYSYFNSNKLYSILYIVCLSFSLVLLFKYFKSTFRYKENNLLLKIKFLRQYYEYVFIMIISIIVSSGIQISKGLDLCVESMDIECIKNQISSLKEEILMGKDLEGSLKNSKFLSKYSLSMIAMGEKSGSLDEILKKSSKRLEKKLLEKLDKIISYVTPGAIIIVTIIIIIFIFICIIPMLDMIYSGVM